MASLPSYCSQDLCLDFIFVEAKLALSAKQPNLCAMAELLSSSNVLSGPSIKVTMAGTNIHPPYVSPETRPFRPFVC